MKMYQVDAFASQLFKGNPAAVCLPEKWPEDRLMQDIARENNLAETAFVVREGDQYFIRWFTPEVEVDLCGHATLASAHVLYHHEGVETEEIRFFSPRSGVLSVARSGELLTLDFPADSLEEIPVPAMAGEALGATPLRAYRGRSDYLLVYESEAQIRAIKPDFGALTRMGERGVIVTAHGEEVDFVSRFFAPQAGIPEDPVTGSAHTTLTPYWAERLGKKTLLARQLSSRGGELLCEDRGTRVKISGKAITYLTGNIEGL